MKKSNFQFSNPILEEVKYRINPDFKKKDGEQINIEIKSRVNISNTSDSTSIVELTLILGKEDETSPFLFEIKEGTQFFWNEDMDKEQVDKFLHINAPALLLGYTRPVVASLTASSPWGAFNVPFIDFTKEKE